MITAARHEFGLENAPGFRELGNHTPEFLIAERGRKLGGKRRNRKNESAYQRDRSEGKSHDRGV